MPRRYEHQPDEDAVRHRRKRADRLLGLGEATLARASGDVRAVSDGAVDAAWEGAACGWYLGEPVEQVFALLERGAGVVARVLPTSRPPYDSWALGSWLSTVAVAGEPAVLAACARQALAPDAFTPELPENAGSAATEQVLAALLLDDVETARRVLADLPPVRLTGPAQQQVEQFRAMLAAVADGDQGALDTAARARYAARARLAGRSAENRRRWTFLLDRGGCSLMVAARRRGLTPAADVPDVPAELLARAGAR